MYRFCCCCASVRHGICSKFDAIQRDDRIVMISSIEPVASTARNHQCVDRIDRWQQPSDESTTKQDFIIADFKSFTQASNWIDKRYCEWRILGCLKWRIFYYIDGGWLYLHMEFDQCRLHSEWNVDVEWYVRITAIDDANEIYENGPHTTQFSNLERSRWLTRFYPYQYKEDGYTVEDRIAVTIEMNFEHIKIDHGLLEIVERITNLERLVMEVKKEQETQAAKSKERRAKSEQRQQDLGLQVEELRNDFDSSFTVRNTQMANLEENVTNLVEEMRDGLEQQATEAYERFERLQRQLENVSAFLQKLLMTNKKPDSTHQRGSLSSNEESSLSERAKSPDSFSNDMCNAQQKRFSSPFIRL